MDLHLCIQVAMRYTLSILPEIRSAIRCEIIGSPSDGDRDFNSVRFDGYLSWQELWHSRFVSSGSVINQTALSSILIPLGPLCSQVILPCKLPCRPAKCIRMSHD